jgi:hypothetical protein
MRLVTWKGKQLHLEVLDLLLLKLIQFVLQAAMDGFEVKKLDTVIKQLILLHLLEIKISF